MDHNIARMPVAARKQLIGFQEDTPLCANCSGFTKSTFKTVDLVKTYKPARCKRFAFDTSNSACCDNWTGKKGEVLV
jgi:hypothetical protein